ncbi:FitA-like ribbon-helix-helix domain-containing protein [Brachybacterium sp. AOP3-A1-3]|uniref:FitA-like ribbon-helix-helix domain-containing protein n=1 Tax=Brachybacterium sp. AOP3-A1-3 TaxID=3457699 RepID=UPI004034B296
MSTLQVRDVRPETAEVLKRRAASRGVSLSEYLRAELDRLASVPSRSEVLARISARSTPELTLAIDELARARAERSGE